MENKEGVLKDKKPSKAELKREKSGLLNVDAPAENGPPAPLKAEFPPKDTKAKDTKAEPSPADIAADKEKKFKKPDKNGENKLAEAGEKKDKKAAPVKVRISRFNPKISEGLTSEQVEQRIAQGAVNVSAVKISKTYSSIFLGNIFTFFNILCYLVAAAFIVAGSFKNLLFMGIISINIIIGIIQEIKAKHTIDKLSLLTLPVANVIRNGERKEIAIKDIVLDDIITLSAGKQIPSDCVIAEGTAEVNEALLTGESVPIKKSVGQLLLAGSFISSGNCVAKIDKVGAGNYISTLSEKVKKYKKPRSELLNSINLFMKVIGFFIPFVALGMGLLNYHAHPNGLPIWDKIVEIVPYTGAVVIGLIPAGMFLLTTVALAVGVIRLAMNKALVQDLYCIEMLARVNVLCLDKTGTITDGRMKVSDCMLLNNNSEFTINEIIGSMLASLNDNNQTSIALFNHFGHNNSLKPTAILNFSSSRKLSAVTFAGAGTYVLGAPEFLNITYSEKVERMINQYASMGLRILMLASAPGSINNEKVPSNLKPVAIITIADNIREDAVSTIKYFKNNDVAIKIISGDNPVTVAEVARRVGVENAQSFISLEGLSEREVINVANKYTVFGRVTPEQKSILIKTLKAAGNTVAMTGDGVNDILAMKEADCAIAIASGSEAARSGAHLVLMDSNFSAMPKVVAEGRRVINNIQKSSSLFLMKTLFTLFLCAVVGVISLISTPLSGTPTQYPFEYVNMILLEFFIIGMASVFLALQPNENRVKGRFIPTVLCKAFPGAIVLTINMIAVYLIKSITWFNISESEFLMMAVMAITFGGLVMLFRVCSPFNAFRGFLYGAILTLTVLFVLLPTFGAPDFLKIGILPLKELINKDKLAAILILAIVIFINLPLSKILIDAFGKIKIKA